VRAAVLFARGLRGFGAECCFFGAGAEHGDSSRECPVFVPGGVVEIGVDAKRDEIACECWKSVKH
jgi:hypothetical protein